MQKTVGTPGHRVTRGFESTSDSHSPKRSSKSEIPVTEKAETARLMAVGEFLLCPNIVSDDFISGRDVF